jgi:two-component system sensor histidine kinase KdpD
VSVDPAQLEHALANLLENALKFSPPDSSVMVKVAQDGHEVIVRIVDHGPGLPPGELGRVFEPFQRASTTGGGSGAGLGLAIAKGFVEANGGRIWVESVWGEGASFLIALPASAEAVPRPERVERGASA